MGWQAMSIRRSKRFDAKPDLVSTTLVYPFTLTTETEVLDAGLHITGGSSAPAGQSLFQVQNSAGTILWYVGVVGGPVTNATDVRSYNTAGTKYVAMSGVTARQYYEYHDGTTSFKMWSGIGAPSTDTVGTAAAGDYYLRRATYDFPIMVGKSVTIGSVTANRFQSISPPHDQANSSSETDVESIVPAKSLFSNFKMVLATAPGAGSTRTETLRYANAASSLTFTIANPATSGSDTTNTPITYSDNTTNKTVAIGFSANIAPASSLAKWRLLQTAPHQHLYATSESGASTTLVRYMGIQESGVETTAAAAAQIFPDTGTLISFTATLSTSAGAGSYALELFKGTYGSETSTGISFTLTGTTPQLFAPVETTVSVAPDDSLYWRITPSATAPSAATIQVSMEYASSTPGNYVLFGGDGGANALNSAVRYNNWYGNAAWNATEANVQALAYATTLVALYARVSVDTGAARTRTVAFRIGGVSSAASVVFNNTGLTKNWTGSVAVATDNNINIIHTPAGTPANANVRYGLCLNTPITSTAVWYVCTAGGTPGTWSQII